MKKLAKNITAKKVNNVINADFENICRMTQPEVKKYVTEKLKETYEQVVVSEGYVFAKGDVPILLVAHMDTVHKETPKAFVHRGNKTSSPQGIGGDDRCGIYIILNIIKKHKCSVVFCEDEEIGGIGAKKFIMADFAKDLDFNYIMEFDRRGSKDAVFYDCDNEAFEEFITDDEDWKTAFGSFSDISIIAPVLGCAAVNLSSGYYNAHTLDEYVMLDELESCIVRGCKLIEKTTDEDKFEYIPTKRKGYDWYDDGYYTNMFGEDDAELGYGLYGVEYIDKDYNLEWDEVYARSKHEAIGLFLSDHPTLTVNDIDIEFYGIDPYYM